MDAVDDKAIVDCSVKGKIADSITLLSSVTEDMTVGADIVTSEGFDAELDSSDGILP